MSESTDLEPVPPVKPVAPWMGGKRLLSKTIVDILERVPHTAYAEPFIGMGGVFFRRTSRPKTEVINDISSDVVTLFRVLQRHYTAFSEMIRWQLASRAEFERLRSQPPDTLTDLERAARFLYLQRMSFGGKVVRQTFGAAHEGSARFDVSRLMPLLEDVHDRLCGVQIEKLPWFEFIGRYDRNSAMFYLDPPYWGNETDYGPGIFCRDDFETMARVLRTLKGQFLLSLNDRKEVREVFRGYQIHAVKTTYSVGGGRSTKPVGEVLIANFPLNH